jgi:hydroxyacylglutathione hydrolase
MYGSLKALTALPATARLWFGHEYTESNLRFAATVEPASTAIADRRASLRPSTTPTTVGLELTTNPFVRSTSVAELAARRQAKDNF